jgi:hypothetical protein
VQWAGGWPIAINGKDPPGAIGTVDVDIEINYSSPGGAAINYGISVRLCMTTDEVNETYTP